MDPNSNNGIFFREQAELISGEYNPILVVFKKSIITKKSLNYLKKLRIIETNSKENILVLEVYYPHRDLLLDKIINYFEDLAIEILKNYLNKRNIEIPFIHAQSLFDAGIWAYKYSVKYQIPYLITEHNQLSFREITKDKSLMAVESLRKAKLNLVVSNDKIRQFAANGLFFDFRNIGNMISKKIYYDSTISKNEKLRFITIGAFSPIKDQITILKSLNIVDKNLSERAEFVWIGQNSWGSNQDNRVNNLLKEFNFTNIDIILEPILNHEEISNYLNSAHLFLFSSLSEGMPVSLLEALACGLPVFSSNCGGVDEVINHNNGKIYQIRDYIKLARLIEDFVADRFCYDADSISKEILSKYGEDSFRKNILKYYKEVENCLM